MTRVLIAVLVVLFGVAAANAAFRVWSSADGSNSVEAQFIQMSGTRVVLEKADGSRVMVPAEKLCAKDQEYLASVVIPELKIKVDKDVDSEKLSEYSGYSSGWVHKREDINVKVLIQKTSKAKCSREFKAHLYIIAEASQGDSRRVIDHKEHSFSFVKSNSTQLSGSASVEFYEYSGYSSGGKNGWEYEGYLVVVEDDSGAVIATETNKSSYESCLQKIQKNINSSSGFSL